MERAGSIPALGTLKGIYMRSSNFRLFKKQMGQANHFLITILIGLDAVKNGAKKEEEFNACWNPESIESSVSRSKKFAINSALSWSVDNLDMYLRLCNREPKLYPEEESIEIAKTKHSVYKKFNCIINNHTVFSESQKAFVDLLICWRNNMVHFDAENQLLQSSQSYFKNIPKNDVVITKYHLNVDEMLERFYNGKSPTFKEITTMISMTIHFVESLDDVLISNVNQKVYLRALLYKEYHENTEKVTEFLRFKNCSIEKKKKKLKQFFITRGTNEDFYNDDGIDYIDTISAMSASEIIEDITSHKN